MHAQTNDPPADAATQLKVLLDEDLDATFRRNPIQATVRGVAGYNDFCRTCRSPRSNASTRASARRWRA